MRFTQIKETCLYVQSLQKIADFYHGKLGLEQIGYKEDRHIFFRVGSSVLLCFIAAKTKNDRQLPPHYGGGNQHLALEVSQAEYNSCKQQIVEAGIELVHEEHWPHGKKSIYFHDPEANLLEVVEEGLWGD